jgi:diguanylate cyclase (GGDEF)-like protein/PAS domain S-box-containing protein
VIARRRTPTPPVEAQHGEVAPLPRLGLGAHAWWLYLAGMSATTAAYTAAHFAGPRWLNSGFAYNVIGGSAVVALLLGTRRNARRGHQLPWRLFALAQALFVTGDVLAYNYKRFFGVELPFPSIADLFYLAFYPLLVAGLLVLIHKRDESRDRATLIDALIIAVAVSALSWIYLMAPYAHDHTLKLFTKLISIAYPMMDILVLSVVLRLAMGGGRRGMAYRFLVCGTGVLLVTDSIYGWKLLHGGYATGGVLDAGWAVFYALLGAAALHPSMRFLSEPVPESDRRLSTRRLALLTCASLTGPIAMVTRDAFRESLDVYVLGAASVVLFSLVIVRMAGIVRRHEEAIRREAALRVAGEALVSAITREDICSAALRATQSVIGHPVTAHVYLAHDSEETLDAVGSTDDEVADLEPLRLSELPGSARELLGERRVLTQESADGPMCLSPLISRDRLRGVLVVRPGHELKRAVEESLAMLATEVALALEGVALTEETLRQRSEARLSALVKNASDVICVVGLDSLVRYLSPSVERMLGHSPATLVGRRLIDVAHPDERPRLLAFLAATAAQPASQPSTAEFRVRHSEHGWRNIEALGTNLLADEAIDGIVLNIRDITERKIFEAELEHRAFHDTLTGLPNRALFRNRVEHALAGQRRGSVPVAVLFLDIDDFKDVNDSLGHAAGDEVLREVGRRLDGCMRPVDTAARLGGDEFAVLIHGSKSEMHCIEIVQRVMQELAAPISLEDRQVTIGATVGIAFSEKGEVVCLDADELLRDADAAMYMAKERGKGRYQVFQPEMHAQALARLELRMDLQRAMEGQEFTLRYQPLIDLARGDMAGMEALVRWEHPIQGTVLPADFIPLLEETGLIVPLGRQILIDACRQAVILQRECPRDPPLSIAVNVSAFQLQRPEFIDDVRGALLDSGIPPGSLILELTESVLIRDIDLSVLRMKDLRALGVKLAIDDFGTGYSSLNYLRRLPVDILKIDRSFLADPSREVTLLTAAVVHLARIFKLQAVVEGVEHEAHLERLRHMGCDFAQGFYFAEPLTSDEILAMAARQSLAGTTNGNGSAVAALAMRAEGLEPPLA